ncbi:TetR/AcrR family transcriptional regulator [Martelella lutilitoris]|uniref:TetR/AcrR family transcriptional regulator n=1 Tax=Martelella lutilitoris TaxID=2583532 RepID=A0A5C4JSZ5_9HYPH|nr:TetR/AcrR family transcriptional regulator [Martelella lutilitoris]TNB47769.1 TetR/AcrR family transcriptional regulator [Martelella lutilitoris]
MEWSLLSISQEKKNRIGAIREKLLEEAEIHSVQNQTLVQKRREQICDAALDLFLEKGFASTTIRDICGRSRVNQASIYDYIANKNDILRRLMNQVWFRQDVPTLAELLGDPDLTLEDAFARYFRDTLQLRRKGTVLIYRSVPHMLDDDRRLMHAREIALIKDVADELRTRTAHPVDERRLEVLANLLIFLAGFGPLRDWLNKDASQETIVDVAAAGAAAMVRAVTG